MDNNNMNQENNENSTNDTNNTNSENNTNNSNYGNTDYKNTNYRNANYRNSSYGNANGSTYNNANRNYNNRYEHYSDNDNIRRLYRSRNNKMLCGVCAGIANYFKCDPTIMRLLLVFLTFCSCGTGILAYIIMAIVVPETPFNE